MDIRHFSLVARLASDGYGWEDVAVMLMRDGYSFDAYDLKQLRDFVLRTSRRSGAVEIRRAGSGETRPADTGG